MNVWIEGVVVKGARFVALCSFCFGVWLVASVPDTIQLGNGDPPLPIIAFDGKEALPSRSEKKMGGRTTTHDEQLPRADELLLLRRRRRRRPLRCCLHRCAAAASTVAIYPQGEGNFSFGEEGKNPVYRAFQREGERRCRIHTRNHEPTVSPAAAIGAVCVESARCARVWACGCVDVCVRDGRDCRHQIRLALACFQRAAMIWCSVATDLFSFGSVGLIAYPYGTCSARTDAISCSICSRQQWASLLSTDSCGLLNVRCTIRT